MATSDPVSVFGWIQEVDRSSPPTVQHLLDASGRGRTSALPWRGQFTPEFVEYILREAELTRGSVVLDPFVGSGSVLFEASRLGLRSIGVDVNPAAVVLSRVCTLVSKTGEERQKALDACNDYLWRRLGDGLFSRNLSGDLTLSSLRQRLEDLADLPDTQVICIEAALLLAFGNKDHCSPRDLKKALGRLRSCVAGLPTNTGSVEVIHGDARSTDVPSDTVDLVLTSPPYINVFNYHQNYRPIIEWLGYEVLTPARSEVGSNRANRGNRFRTVIQYAHDMLAALAEIERVLTPEGTAVLVVGRESAVRSAPFYNGEIVASLARAGGMSILSWKERKFTSRYGATVYEDILSLRPAKRTSSFDPSPRIADATAAAALVRARGENGTGEVSEDIDMALADIGCVTGTPLLDRQQVTGV